MSLIWPDSVDEVEGCCIALRSWWRPRMGRRLGELGYYRDNSMVSGMRTLERGELLDLSALLTFGMHQGRRQGGCLGSLPVDGRRSTSTRRRAKMALSRAHYADELGRHGGAIWCQRRASLEEGPVEVPSHDGESRVSDTALQDITRP